MLLVMDDDAKNVPDLWLPLATAVDMLLNNLTSQRDANRARQISRLNANRFGFAHAVSPDE